MQCYRASVGAVLGVQLPAICCATGELVKGFSVWSFVELRGIIKDYYIMRSVSYLMCKIRLTHCNYYISFFHLIFFTQSLMSTFISFMRGKNMQNGSPLSNMIPPHLCSMNRFSSTSPEWS